MKSMGSSWENLTIQLVLKGLILHPLLYSWSAAVKVSHGASKDMLAAAAKADALKEQHEEEQAKFENCQVCCIVIGLV